MFTVTGPSAVIATVSELKARMKETIAATRRGPVYLVRDGQPVAGIISMEMMAVLEEALEDQRLARIAGARLTALRRGEDELLDADEFWPAADASRDESPPARAVSEPGGRPRRKRAAG